MLAESVSVYSSNTHDYRSVLADLGYAGDTLTGALNQIVTSQGYMMATNDFFRISCYGFVALAILVWVTKPRKGASAAMGH